MVALSSMLVALALGNWHVVSGAPLESNPITPMEATIVLNHQNPAFAGKIKRPIYKPVVVENVVVLGDNKTFTGTNALSTTTTAHRRMEATNTDIWRLEQVYGQLERNVYKLAKKGEADAMPWPGHYWPVYKDGINLRWKSGDMSPAEKYARAFGENPDEFMNRISQNNGIKSQTDRPTCESHEDCAYLNDYSACGKREGASTGYCIPTWFGICHAWAPAAMMEPEPKCAVTKNGVTFRPYDIKALLTQIYDGANVDTVFTGARFDGGEQDMGTDRFDRFIDASYRDLGPGFFHLAFTNILGKHQKSFVLDVDAGSQVWNQPVRKYKILDQKLMAVQEAAQRFYGQDQYPFNPMAKKIMYTQTEFSWVVEGVEDGELTAHFFARRRYTTTKTYTYLLELDDQDNIIGGEWLDDTNADHPDFLWFPTTTPHDDAITNVGLSYRHIKELLHESRTKSSWSCWWDFILGIF